METFNSILSVCVLFLSVACLFYVFKCLFSKPKIWINETKMYEDRLNQKSRKVRGTAERNSGKPKA
jgi:hypothetical protein